jgi:hypothetical protein
MKNDVEKMKTLFNELYIVYNKNEFMSHTELTTWYPEEGKVVVFVFVGGEFIHTFMRKLSNNG